MFNRTITNQRSFHEDCSCLRKRIISPSVALFTLPSSSPLHATNDAATTRKIQQPFFSRAFIRAPQNAGNFVYDAISLLLSLLLSSVSGKEKRIN